MITRLIDFSVKNRFLVLLLVGAAAVAGAWSLQRVPLDAIPDLSDTQVIVYSRWDRSPDVVEKQITYPIVTAMLGAPKVRAVRGFSDFGYSFVYVVFEDGTDIYWARTRTLEYLSGVLSQLPPDAKTELGPDASGLGWVYQYALVDTSGERSLADLRSYQDWTLRYYLKAVPGVAEVAAVGGFVRQYQVNVDPNKLRNYGLSIQRVVEVVRGGNIEAGGRLIEFGGTEYMVRGRGYAQSIADFESIVVSASESGTPIRIRDIGQVTIGPDLRRGVADLDGTGEAVSGIIVMRQGENALDVIDRVKKRIKEIEPGLPKGMSIVPIYDRSDLIRRAIGNVSETLIEVILTVVFIVLLFLWHVPSAIIPVITIPVAVLVSFIPFRMLGITANIMSLGGIAIAMGELVDAAIVVVEQTHKKLEERSRSGEPVDHKAVVIEAVKEVAPASFFALLVIAVSFLPVLTLEAQEGRLFKPLAYTKTLAMIVAAFLADHPRPGDAAALHPHSPVRVQPGVAPAGRERGARRPHPLRGRASGQPRVEPALRADRAVEPALEVDGHRRRGRRWPRHRTRVLQARLRVHAAPRRGRAVLHADDDAGHLDHRGADAAAGERPDHQAVPRSRPRARQGGAGGYEHRPRAALDDGDGDHAEAAVRVAAGATWYSGWAPEWLKPVFRPFTPDRISQEELVEQLNEALKLPGVSNAWTMPIKARIDMLTTGIRTPVGLKISGADLQEIEDIGTQIETLLPSVRGTRNVFAERTGGGYFLDFEWNRDELARYGLSIDEAQTVVQSAIGGENVTTTVEGRERYPGERPLHARLPVRPRRARPRAGAGVGRQRQIPLGQLATIKVERAGDDPQRERPADRLRLRRRGRPRHRRATSRRPTRLIREKVKLPPGTPRCGAASTRRWRACASG